MSESTFMRLLDRLPDTACYSNAACPVSKGGVGKVWAVNRNEELHSVLRGKLNGLARSTKGYSKTVGC